MIQAVKASFTTEVVVLLQQVTQYIRKGSTEDPTNQLISTVLVGIARAETKSSGSLPYVLAGDGNDNGHADGGHLSQQLQQERLDDLYYLWEQFQTSYDRNPNFNQPDPLLGGVNNVSPPYDPLCVVSEQYGCPQPNDDIMLIDIGDDIDEAVDGGDGGDGESNNGIDDSGSDDNTTLYIIIGVVVGSVALLFAIVVGSIVHCRNTNKACFAKRTRKKKSSQATGSSGKSVELTASSAGSSTPGAASATTTPETGAGGSLPAAAPVDDPTLPPDWIALTDQNTGKIYYSNKITLESTWDHPAMEKDEEMNEYGW